MKMIVKILEGFLYAVIFALLGVLIAGWLAYDIYRALTVFVIFQVLALWNAAGAVDEALYGE